MTQSQSSSREQQTDLQRTLTSRKESSLKKYQSLVVGERGLGFLFRYELTMLLFGYLPGPVGLLLRKKFFPGLFKRVGRGVVFGRNVTIRHPHKINIGDNVIIDDNCVLDAKGGPESYITLGNNVLLSRNTILSCKGGSIELGDNTNIGMNCLMQSESSLQLGKNILLASYCYLVAGGNHGMERTDIPIIQQPPVSRGGIAIEDNVWLGARVTVADGVRVGRDSVAGAGAVIIRDVPEFVIVGGVPAKVLKERKAGAMPATSST